MRQRLFSQVDAAQHARYLFHTFFLAQFGYCCAGSLAVPNFVHEQVLVALRSDLRQVCNGQYLAAIAEAA